MSKTRSISAVGVVVVLLAGLLACGPRDGGADAEQKPISLSVDATNLPQRIIGVKQSIPVRSGEVTLLFPQWLPGNHSPSGPIDKIAGITFEGGGKRLEWKRDPLNVYAFKVTVPDGVSTIDAAFEYLTPTDTTQGRVVMTPNMLNLQWNAVLLYPEGKPASKIPFTAKVTYPPGFQAGTALEASGKNGDTVDYETVPLDVLVDSPVYAGRFHREFDLAPGAAVPVRLQVFADAPEQLDAKPEHIEAHKALVQQAVKLYGAQHYNRYDFLLSLSDQLSSNGLEHQRSSENGQSTDYFTGWNPALGSDDLLGHEYTHSWNGKFRRPADLWTPDYNVPMQDSLMWVYEGQTQYWGNILTGRSGLRPADVSRDALAAVVATYTDGRPGLSWRSLQDTTNDPIIAQRRTKPYRSWQLSEDYYQGGQLVWLGVDARIRELSGNTKSLDDFARAFFGVDDGKWESQKTYDFDDVVSTLNGVVADDWSKYLRDRLDGKESFAGSIEKTGWKLVYDNNPGAFLEAQMKEAQGAVNYTYSIGLNVSATGKVTDVRWDGPAFKAGVGTGMTVVSVNDAAYSQATMQTAIEAAKTNPAPIRLQVKDFDQTRTVEVNYHDGLRYPHLQRIDGTPDYLSQIYAARQ
ncbi:Peptidase M61 domain protein OS=Tsukamurella paurometabola (strain ATCC 8368 / DSM / CCUG 35730/ CIP 100753 / JCM 10117 / KCTC 9821 / NBRC 16120 / NCIMB 702349 / NCTC 13040) OX=521096 GN=Tpau_2029 PE=4 SV=1 [Tsukamurella paurometabola]|uniref:Peptidase M61 domain protein n=1 Tax=Tsukamurella paurometabola (strain ATCC 8368 / DSM 20162 / CCUG 35730 / CIP 100753 / JCM 10117 / KCTC 9821 / NBRC 16120 / NCIMB 702349 / NCTC 13040) TaxID=521096 RepID=D5UNS3_TSUPD|nr:M61 family metallopeptidase [Tsukamurella paurometabola]ADG78641.1 peptidase M61 domain protein [Tsukamurella paurometabola DSM 20162]SUP32534.1 Predicted protease with the C-terminal PDZ domain [Tsukamurella paurometabola]